MTQGKGSTRRPQQVSNEQFAENWERFFGNPFVKLARWQAEEPTQTPTYSIVRGKNPWH